MAFYDLDKAERKNVVAHISSDILSDLISGSSTKTSLQFAHEDTYIRKSAYLAIGRIFQANENLKARILDLLKQQLIDPDFKVRQTVINAAGEIGKREFETVVHFFDTGLADGHHSVRNAVIGSVKKMGEVNPLPVLNWAKTYLHHPDPEIRREICHGIELRGRTHPADILPFLKQLQFDQKARVRNTLVHVLGQISYKKGCLQTVLEDLRTWENKDLVKKALLEIVDVHHRYRNFSVLSAEEAVGLISKRFNEDGVPHAS